jgi:hypothetical protein
LIRFILYYSILLGILLLFISGNIIWSMCEKERKGVQKEDSVGKHFTKAQPTPTTRKMACDDRHTHVTSVTPLLVLWAEHMVWRTSHTPLLYFGIDVRNRRTFSPIFPLDSLTLEKPYWTYFWKTVTLWRNINRPQGIQLRLSPVFYTVQYFSCFSIFQHSIFLAYFISFFFLVNFQSIEFIFFHTSFYTGNYCVIFTGSNLTLDHSILFLGLYFPVWSKIVKHKSNRLVVECSSIEARNKTKISSNLPGSLINWVIVLIYICSVLLFIYIVCLIWPYLCMIIV